MVGLNLLSSCGTIGVCNSVHNFSYVAAIMHSKTQDKNINKQNVNKSQSVCQTVL